MSGVDKRNIVLKEFYDDAKYNEIYLQEATDHDDNHFIIFERSEDIERFVDYAKEILGIKDDITDWELEEELETNFVFDDEYTTCSDCGHIIQTSPNSYFWKPDFYVGDGFIVCNKCFNDTESYQEAYLNDLINNYNNANQLLTEEQLKDLGFTRIDEDYQDGFYGVNDSPKEIYEKLSDKYEEVLFNIDSVGQFHTDFSVWVRGEID